MIRPPRLALVAALLGAHALSAQQITPVHGVVHDSVSGYAVPGAVIAALDSAGSTTARAIADGAGRFAITVPAGRASLRVIRIGFRPRDVRIGPSPAARATLITVTLQQLPALLADVRVSDHPICPGSADESGALALWEQARAGLLATVVARETNPAAMDMLEFSTDRDPGSGLVLKQTTRRVAGTTGRPFIAAANAGDFAQHGYMHHDSTGLTFNAPDADVLLDENFARTHCFGIVRDNNDHRGELGLSFEPAPGQQRADFVDVRGVLWLASNPPELRTLEFAFTGLDRAYSDAGTGGTLSFRNMRNGMIYIDRWTMLLPAIEATTPQRRLPSTNADEPLATSSGLRHARVLQLRDVGGDVLSARWPDGSHAEIALGAVTGVVRDRGNSPVPGVFVHLAGTETGAVTDSLGRFTMSPVLAGRYGLDAVDSVYAAFIEPPHSSATITVRDDTLRVKPVTLTSRLDGLNRLCAHSSAGAPSSNVVVLLGTLTGPQGPLTGDVAVHSGFKPFGTRTESAARPDSTVARPSDDGQFVICGARRTAFVFLRAVRGDTVLGDTAFVAHAWPAQLVDWSVTPGRPRGIASGSFAGFVRVDTTSTPVIGANIEIAALDQSERSAGDGAFLMTDLPPGRYAVQVSGLGYTVVQDSVSIVDGKQARRVYEMQARRAPRAAAPPAPDSAAPVSPQFRAFEERSRARTGGYFVTEAELRSYESLPLVSALEKYIPGLSTVNYEGATLLASGRGASTLQLLPHAVPGDSVSPRRCWVSLYSDGVRIFTADSTRAAPDFSNYSTSDYGGIEFYPGGGSLPPLFDATAGNDCGVLALWKRER